MNFYKEAVFFLKKPKKTKNHPPTLQLSMGLLLPGFNFTWT